MAVRTYSMQELRRIVKESVNEFEPKFGSKNLQKDNKSINDKAYKESGTRTKDYDGGARDNHNKNGEFEHPQTDNKGMHDLKYDLISDAFKDRVKSQSNGYVSVEAEERLKKHGNNELAGKKPESLLVRFLKQRSIGMEVVTSMEYGFDPLGIEADAFGFLAVRRLQCMPTSYPFWYRAIPSNTLHSRFP